MRDPSLRSGLTTVITSLKKKIENEYQNRKAPNKKNTPEKKSLPKKKTHGSKKKSSARKKP